MQINIEKENIKRVSISKSKKGYNYATITALAAEDVYVNFSVEWEGDTIPDIVMDMASLLVMEKASLDTDVLDFEARLVDYINKKG